MSVPVIASDGRRAMAQLSNLTNEELDAILNQDEKIVEIIANIENSYLNELAQQKENIIAQNNSMAEYNLSKEPELTEGRQQLVSLYEEVEKLNKVVEEKQAELREKGGDISVETALALLQTAASEIEEESDQYAGKFLESEIELDEFLDNFLSKRKLMHTRLVKADKLAKILQRGDPSLGIGVPNYINAPPVSINKGYFPGVPVSPPSTGGVPYPVGPLNMPMPPSMSYYQNHY